MTPPPFLTNDFLLACLQYEYYKNTENVDKAHANICQMMQSECVREEIIHRKGWSSDDDEPANESLTKASSRIANTPSHRPGRSRKKQLEAEQAAEIEKKKMRLTTPEKKLKPDFDDSDDELKREPTATLADYRFIRKNEDDIAVEIISKSLFLTFFSKFEKISFKDSTILREEKCSLSQLRRYAFCYGWSEHHHETPIDEIKSTIDFHKVKLHLSNSETNERLRVEHWDHLNGGCWMWIEDDVRFIENFNYETLAANYMYVALRTSMSPLESLEFDIEEKTKWSPELRHSAAFWYKVKKSLPSKLKVFGIKKFSMKVFKCRDRVDCPFRLLLVDAKLVQEIKLRVWDDSYLCHSAQRLEYLNVYAKNVGWGSAHTLDIRDPNLSWFVPRFPTFRVIKRLKMDCYDERKIRESFKDFDSWERCHVTVEEKIDLEKFAAQEKEKIVDKRILAKEKPAGKPIAFNVTIEEFRISYEKTTYRGSSNEEKRKDPLATPLALRNY